jgi:ribosomal protein S18 acetylase RimI-like enzyme
MSADLTFSVNQSLTETIAVHLRNCDAHFVPPLSTRVDIEDYAHKLAQHAMRFEAWAEGGLVGLVAAYANDLDSRVGYISNVSVSNGWLRRGLASQLMAQCIDHCANAGMRRIRLEVSAINQPAIRLYEGLGFAVEQRTGEVVSFARDINGRGAA